MTERVVINSGPLITLAAINALDVAGRLPMRFLCPAAVREELAEGEAAGHRRVAPSWLVDLSLASPLPRVELSMLGAGEAAVIAGAIEHGIERVCIDEWKGRRAALTAGLKVTGVLGLLARAKRLGLISSVRQYTDRAVAAGIRYHPELLREVLAAVGEAAT